VLAPLRQVNPQLATIIDLTNLPTKEEICTTGSRPPTPANPGASAASVPTLTQTAQSAAGGGH
jgi:hypothetical protein